MGNNPSFARVNSRDRREKKENKGPSTWVFFNSDGQKFEGYCLFDPDPKAEDNPGYLEYSEHWDQAMNTFVPCWGKENKCIYCLADTYPSTRALGAFYVESFDDGKETRVINGVRIFRLNWKMLQEWWDTFDEDGSRKGKRVRIKSVDKGSGVYSTRFFDDKELTEKEIESYTEQIPDLGQIIQTKLDNAIQALKIQDALHDDEFITQRDLDEAESEMPRARGGKNEDEVDQELEAATFTVVSVNTSSGTVEVEELETDLYMSDQSLINLLEDLEPGDKIEVTYGVDEEEDFVASSLRKVVSKKKVTKE